MKVSDLIELLEGMNPDSDVALAIQPNYPFEHSIGDVIEITAADVEWAVMYDEDGSPEVNETESESDAYDLLCRLRNQGTEAAIVGRPASDRGDWIPLDDLRTYINEQPTRVLIAESGQTGYLDGIARENLGW